MNRGVSNAAQQAAMRIRCDAFSTMTQGPVRAPNFPATSPSGRLRQGCLGIFRRRSHRRILA